MEIPNVGHRPPKGAKRDAIHSAVAPAEAGVALEPGQHVARSSDGTFTPVGKKIGIVDPYLKSPVAKGEMFWLFLYPGSVTSLRHVWTHPDFAATLPEVKR